MFRTTSVVAALVLAWALAACGAAPPPPPEKPETPPPAIQSNDILARDANSAKSFVKHILITWEKRTREEADALAAKLLERVRAGEDIEPLMREFSADLSTAKNGRQYEVTADAKLIFEFKRMGLRLKVNEAGLVLSDFGWHVMKRVE